MPFGAKKDKGKGTAEKPPVKPEKAVEKPAEKPSAKPAKAEVKPAEKPSIKPGKSPATKPATPPKPKEPVEMVEVKLKVKAQPSMDLECDSITPDSFANKDAKDIAGLPVFLGNRQQTIADYFDVSGKGGKSAEATKITIEGDCKQMKRIGEKMTDGEVVVNGNSGMHVGAMMTGGKLTVKGNAGDWAGAEMAGGELVIEGNAGNTVGSAYRGNWIGMINGTIIVKGTVGIEALAWARSSKAKEEFPKLICGGADKMLGLHNHGGTIICNGECDIRAGADMARGIIILNGPVKGILPGFKKEDEVPGDKIEMPTGEKLNGKYAHYLGDYAVAKKPTGHLYVKI